MNYEIDKFIREYFEARPQLDPPAYSSIVGYAVPAPCLHMIESLLNDRHQLRGENRKQTAEGKRKGMQLRIALSALEHYADASWLAESDIKGVAAREAIETIIEMDTDSGSPTPLDQKSDVIDMLIEVLHQNGIRVDLSRMQRLAELGITEEDIAATNIPLPGESWPDAPDDSSHEHCEVHSFQGIGGEACPWCELDNLRRVMRSASDKSSDVYVVDILNAALNPVSQTADDD